VNACLRYNPGHNDEGRILLQFFDPTYSTTFYVSLYKLTAYLTLGAIAVYIVHNYDLQFVVPYHMISVVIGST